MKKLGEGAFGVVLRCRDAELKRDVALKLLKDEVTNEEMVHRFRREATTAARVQHPNVVSVFDAGTTDDGHHYIVSEYIRGRTLEARLATGLPVAVEQARRWVEQLLGALEAVHAAGLLHRDIKPGNVMVRGEDALLCDFGLSRFIDNQTLLTATGLLVGTPLYFSPELLQGEPSSPGSDLFGLGALGYEVAYGRPWWPAANLEELFEMIRAGHPLDPARFGKDPELDELLLRLLDPDPTRRLGAAGPAPVSPPEPAGEAPQSAAAPSSQAPSPPGPPVPPTRPPAVPMMVAVALVTGLGLGFLARHPEAPAPPELEEVEGVTESRAEPEELAVARRGLKAGTPHTQAAARGPAAEIEAALPDLIDTRTPLKLRRLVRGIAAAAGDPGAERGPALDTIDRATDRFRVLRAVLTQVALGGLSTGLDGLEGVPLTGEEHAALRRNNEDMEQEAMRLLDELPPPGRGDPSGTHLALRLYLHRIRLDHPMAAAAMQEAARRIAASSPPEGRRLAAALWSVVDLDERERALSPEALSQVLLTLARDLPGDRRQGHEAAWATAAEDACVTGAIVLRRLGSDAPTEALQALDTLGHNLASFHESAPRVVGRGLQRAIHRLTATGPFRAAPGPVIVAARERLAGMRPG